MSIREHGGAVRYWRREEDGARAVLCRDGYVLLYRKGGRWRVPIEFMANMRLLIEMLEQDREWQSDTRPSMTAAITRTGREARRTR